MPRNDNNRTHNSGRGFAGMDPDRQREIAAKGGRSVPADERSFSKDHELAAEAGRKGGENSHGGHSQSRSSGSRPAPAIPTAIGNGL